MSLQHVAEEERHEAGEDLSEQREDLSNTLSCCCKDLNHLLPWEHGYLVLLAPKPGAGCGHAHQGERVLPTDDQHDGEQLEVGEEISQVPAEEEEEDTPTEPGEDTPTEPGDDTTTF